MDTSKLMNSVDGAEWARAFAGQHPGVDVIEMTKWFAPAIMAGYDEATRRHDKRLADMRACLKIIDSSHDKVHINRAESTLYALLARAEGKTELVSRDSYDRMHDNLTSELESRKAEIAHLAQELDAAKQALATAEDRLARPQREAIGPSPRQKAIHQLRQYVDRHRGDHQFVEMIITAITNEEPPHGN